MLLDLQTLPPQAREAFGDLQAEIARLQIVLKLKDEQIRFLHLQRWGPKADKLSEAQLALLPQELLVTAPEVEQEAAQPEEKKTLVTVPKAKPPRGPHPGRTVLPAHLERREEIITCHPAQCACPTCGLPRPLIGYEIREELDCRPAEYFVRVLKREKRGSHCLEEQGVVVAPAPAQIVPKGKLADAFIIEVLAAKFQQHTPVYRQCAVLLEDHGIDLSRQTLNEAILAAAQLLVPVVQSQAAELLAGSYLQVDETTLPCQTPEKTGRNHQAYLWEYGRPAGPVVFDFQMGRGREGPARYLKGFRGKIQCDGYGAYDQLGEGITFVACMAHIRRGFVDAAKLAPLDPRPVEIIQQIGRLYDLEGKARPQNLRGADRRQLRQEHSRPVMDALKTRLVQLRQELTPASGLAKACDYAFGQWERMEQYLEDGEVEIDNNWCYAARGITKVMPTTGLCRVEFRTFEFPEETEDLEIAHAA